MKKERKPTGSRHNRRSTVEGNGGETKKSPATLTRGRGPGLYMKTKLSSLDYIFFLVV